MQKLISFSLFGQHSKYLIGLKKNIKLIKKYYPGWNIIIYYKGISDDYLNQIKDDVILRNMDDSNLCGTMWRFLAHDEPDTERFIIRDVDSRINQREVDAVNVWIKSDKILHIMRDHPHHGYVIMGGMWGMLCQKDFSMKVSTEQYMQNKDPEHWSMTDMLFLKDVLYPKYCNNSKIHATYGKFELHAEDFPSPLIDKRFVGEIYNDDDTREYQYTLI